MHEKSPSALIGMIILAAPSASAFGFSAANHRALRELPSAHLRNGGWVGSGSPRRTALGGLSMEKKKFKKEYDNAFDDFRTSGSMPDIPSLGEQYGLEASYARARGADINEAEGLQKRLTEAQAELERMQNEGLDEYEELKKSLLFDTFFIGALACCNCNLWFDPYITNSLILGSAGSFAYAFLLTRSADRMGSNNPQGGLDPGTPGRIAILVLLIGIFSKNKTTLNIIPILIGFFAPYKLASLVPAFTSAPPLRATELREWRNWWQKDSDPPYKVELGSELRGVSRGAQGFSDGPGDAKTQSSAPLGQRKILSAEEQYEALKRGTMD